MKFLDSIIDEGSPSPGNIRPKPEISTHGTKGHPFGSQGIDPRLGFDWLKANYSWYLCNTGGSNWVDKITEFGWNKWRPILRC